MEDIRIYDTTIFPINEISYIRLSRDKGYSFSHAKGKEKYSLIYTQSGAIKYTFQNNTIIQSNAGEMCFIPKGIPYQNEYLKDNTTIKLLEFSTHKDTVPQFLQNVHKMNNAKITELFNEIKTQTMTSNYFFASKIYELIYELENHSKEIPNKYKKILPALRHINHYFYENKKIDEYAKMCYMSESNFRKLFREYVGMSIIDYRNDIRIKEVKKLLESGEYTVADAAYSAGFNNLSFYYKIVKNKT